MMRMTVLASGSKGNSAVIASSHTRILVDAGLSCRELMRRMAAVGEDPSQLDAILITHEHADHVSGLPVLARRLNIPVYFTEATHRAWVRQMTPRSSISYKQWLEKVQREKQERLDAQALAHQIATDMRADDDIPADNFFADSIDVDAVAGARRETAVDATTDPAKMPARTLRPKPGRVSATIPLTCLQSSTSARAGIFPLATSTFCPLPSRMMRRILAALCSAPRGFASALQPISAMCLKT